MKAPKKLQHTWEDLTGQDELSPPEMEDLRVFLKTLFASNLMCQKEALQQFFQNNTTYLLLRPTSDFSVVLYRLLEQVPRETLNCTTAFVIPEETISMGQFMQLVENSFLVNRRPVSIVSGTPPGICL
jgi:hypothetical protein